MIIFHSRRTCFLFYLVSSKGCTYSSSLWWLGVLRCDVLFVLCSPEWDSVGGVECSGRSLWAASESSASVSSEAPRGSFSESCSQQPSQPGGSGHAARLCGPSFGSVMWCEAVRTAFSLTPKPECPGPHARLSQAGSLLAPQAFLPAHPTIQEDGTGNGNGEGSHAKPPPSLHQSRGFLWIHWCVCTCYYLFLKMWWFLINWKSVVQFANDQESLYEIM